MSVEFNIISGKTALANAVVNERNTAKAVGSGDLDVFSTPMMIALMEQAARNCVAEALEPGQTTVGTQISVSHIAASPLGAVITATATVTGVSGRRLEFAVTASDGAVEIGNGNHTRMVVDSERFMAKLKG